jgi:arginase
MKHKMILTPYFLDERLDGLLELAGEDWHIVNPDRQGADRQERMIGLYRPLAQAVQSAVISGLRPVSIAGDCCTTIGVLAGLQQADLKPTLIWLDAHGDFNTWQTSPSGFLGGMPLAMLVGRGELRLNAGVGLQPLPEERVILSDARDLDPEEQAALAASAVHHLPRVDLLAQQPLPPGPLYIHFDTDVIDPQDAPAMNYLAPGGASLAELHRVFHYLHDSGQVAAVSVSTWNPDLDQDGRSRQAALSLLGTLLGDQPLADLLH